MRCASSFLLVLLTVGIAQSARLQSYSSSYLAARQYDAEDGDVAVQVAAAMLFGDGQHRSQQQEQLVDAIAKSLVNKLKATAQSQI